MAAMDVVVRHVGGMAFVARGPSEHWLVMDGREPGSDEPQRAPGPMEVLLMALGGCTGMDVVSILRKKRVAFAGVEVRVHGERAPDHPRRYTRVRIEYVVKGAGLPRKAVEDAARLSFERYCSVAASLREAVEVSYTVSLEEATPGAPAQAERPAVESGHAAPPPG